MPQKFKAFPTLEIFRKSDLHLYKEYFQLRKYKKHEIIHYEGKVCRSLFFINSGLVFAYNNLSNILWYEFEGSSFTELQGFYAGRRSAIYIKAAEPDTELLCISRANIDLLCGKYSQWALWANEFYLHELHRISKYYEALRNKDASERYNLLIEAHPEIIQRIPLKHIASYLGISQISLSRIRAGKQKRKRNF